MGTVHFGPRDHTWTDERGCKPGKSETAIGLGTAADEGACECGRESGGVRHAGPGGACAWHLKQRHCKRLDRLLLGTCRACAELHVRGALGSHAVVHCGFRGAGGDR